MSNNLGLSQIAATQSNKHVTANDQVGEIDAALTEVLSVEVDDTNAASVLTADFRRHAFFDLVDAATPPNAAITLSVPAIKRGLFVVRNETAQLVTIEITGQPATAPTISAGVAGLLICDGMDVILAGSSAAGSDEKVKVSANDTTPAYLIDKLLDGAGLAVVETDDGSDESVTLRAARLGEIRYYTADDTWNKPADLDFAIMAVVGGGGGGGGTEATGVGQVAAAGGGGAGGASIKKVAAASLGFSETVTIGAGGTAGDGTNAATGGGTSSFGAHCSATGGAGGSTGTSSSGSGIFVGGLPGLGADGDLDLEGGAGGTSNIIGGIRVSMGFGGGSLYGGSTRAPSNNEGLSGVSPGAAGSGAASSASQSARNGGNGASGIVIVWEYLK